MRTKQFFGSKPTDPVPDENGLVEIQDVKVDPNLSYEERIAEFVRQIRNPYHFRCGKFTVHAQYTKDGPTLEECLMQILC